MTFGIYLQQFYCTACIAPSVGVKKAGCFGVLKIALLHSYRFLQEYKSCNNHLNDIGVSKL